MALAGFHSHPGKAEALRDAREAWKEELKQRREKSGSFMALTRC